jgi:hypothetical protein
MIWFFERNGEYLRCEVRDGATGEACELVITYPDGRQRVEPFEEPGALARRQRELELGLVSDGWAAAPSSRH